MAPTAIQSRNRMGGLKVLGLLCAADVQCRGQRFGVSS